MFILGERRFINIAFDSEEELENVVVTNSESLFGPSSIFLPKALIHTKDGFGTIPDGFVIDLANRRWFIVEVELSKHSVWNHIAPQVAKQYIASTQIASKQLLVDLAVEKIQADPDLKEKFADEEIEEINNSLIELDANITKATQDLDSLRGQRRNQLEGRRSRDYESNKAKTRQLVDRARDDARKKYEQGEKLSLDELKLVFADDNEILK